MYGPNLMFFFACQKFLPNVPIVKSIKISSQFIKNETTAFIIAQTIENAEELCIQFFLFFFHAKSGSLTINHRKVLSDM